MRQDISILQLLTEQSDRYKKQVQDANVELYFAEKALSSTAANRDKLVAFNLCCLKLAELSESFGDEERRLWALKKLHYRLLEEIRSLGRADCFRLDCLSLANKSLQELVRYCRQLDQCDRGFQVEFDTLSASFESTSRRLRS